MYMASKISPDWEFIHSTFECVSTNECNWANLSADHWFIRVNEITSGLVVFRQNQIFYPYFFPLVNIFGLQFPIEVDVWSPHLKRMNSFYPFSTILKHAYLASVNQISPSIRILVKEWKARLTSKTFSMKRTGIALRISSGSEDISIGGILLFIEPPHLTLNVPLSQSRLQAGLSKTSRLKVHLSKHEVVKGALLRKTPTLSSRFFTLIRTFI